MQFTTALLALAATAFAAPDTSSSGWGECTFGAWRCSLNGHGIDQCDVSNSWVTLGGCAKNELCAYDKVNYLPYCFAVPGSKKDKRGGGGGGYGYPPTVCDTPGTYTCRADKTGINVCNTEDQVVLNGWCPEGTHCEPLATAGYTPFCVSDW